MSAPEPDVPAPAVSAIPAPERGLHIRPTAELAERLLLPGDPGRALALAQTLITEPRMFNHHRGLWGYTGPARADGGPLTIQSTGMGGPSAAIVLSELIALGARRAIRVGTCGALSPELGLGELVIARESICRDGCSRTLWAAHLAATGDQTPAGAETDIEEHVPADATPEECIPAGAETDIEERVPADAILSESLAAAAPAAHAGTVMSVDLFYDPEPDRGPHRLGKGGDGEAIAIEMESATLFAIGARAGIQVACVLAVTDTFDATGARTRIDDHEILSAAESMGAAAVVALGG